MIPTKDGLIAAADSRITMHKYYLDNAEKLHPVEKQSLIYGVTGVSNLYTMDEKDVETLDALKDWLSHNRPKYSLSAEVGRFFSEQKDTIIINKDTCAQLSKFMLESLAKLGDEELRKSGIGRADGTGSAIIIGQLDRNSGTQVIASMILEYDSRGHPSIKRTDVTEIKQTDNASNTVRTFGESEYVDKNVAHGYGQRFLNGKFQQILDSAKIVSDRTFSDAAFLAYEIITAAEKKTEKIPAPSGIGGDVKLIFISRKSHSIIDTLKPDTDFKIESK